MTRELLCRNAKLCRLSGKLTLKLGRRDPQLARQLFGALAKLTGAESALRYKLLSRKARLSLLLQKLTGKLLCRNAKLCRLTGKLALKLCRRNAQLTGELFGALAQLTRAESTLGHKLLGRKARLGLLLQKLTRELLCRNAQLGRLTSKLTLKLGGRDPELTGKLFRPLAELTGAKRSGLSELLGRESLLTGGLERLLTKLTGAKYSGLRQLLDGKARLGRQLLCRKAKLTLLLRRLCGQLLCRKAKLTGGLCCRQTGLCALRAQSAGKLRRLLRPSLLRFKRRLRALCGRLKACLPHLRRGPPLLLQDIALKFLLGHRLTGATKGACANSLRPDALLCNLALTRNVGQSLLHRGVVKLVHKGSGGSRVKRRSRARQACNTLLRGGRPKGPRLLQRLSRLRGNSASTLNCRGLVRSRLLRGRLTACTHRRRHSARRAHNIANAAKSLLICANAACGSLLRRGPRGLCPCAKIGRRLRCTKSRAQTCRPGCFRATKTGRPKRLRPKPRLRACRLNNRLRAKPCLRRLLCGR